MTDAAHVSTKFPNSLSDSREITLVHIDNPGQSAVLNYRTALDPALVATKLVPVDQRLLDLNGEPIPAWVSNYGTGLSDSEIWHKTNLLAGGKQVVSVGDAPWVNDLGPIVDIPSPDNNNLSDDWHKAVVTDLCPTDVVIAASIQFPYVPFLTSLYLSQMILFPVSSRHIVKTSDGTLHAVTSYTISGLSRIVYFKSTNGGVKWTALVVDNNDGQHYILPSITCDRSGGIHITYTRWDQVTSDTFWLYCNNDVPTGFELASDPAGSARTSVFGDRVVCGGEGTFTSLTYNDPHGHSWTTVNGSPTASSLVPADRSLNSITCDNWHHTVFSKTQSLVGSQFPPYRTLRVLRYPGIPTILPSGIIIPFDSSVPAGFTRYSAQDGYYIRGSTTVGTVGGAFTHYHNVSGSISGDGCSFLADVYVGSQGIDAHSHTHSGNFPTTNNVIPGHSSYLGILSSPATVIPSHSILMFATESLLSSITHISKSGDVLDGLSMYGANGYAGNGVTALTHNHPDFTYYSSSPTSGSGRGNFEWDTGVASTGHAHVFQVSGIGQSNSLPSLIRPYMYHVDSSIDLTTYGNDLFYIYIAPDGSLAAPVNISLIKQYYPSFEGVCLADGVDDVHFQWSAQGLNTTPGRARVCYKKISSGILGARVDLTTSDNHMLYSSMDIDINGDVHSVWFNATSNASIQYKKSVDGSFVGVAAETVDNDSYCGVPSNIITDKDCNTFLLYARWTDAGTAIKEVFYRKRDAATGTWGAAVNLSPNKAASGYNQFTGQICLDNKGNVVFTWSGKGYGAHTSVYHPVYRYLSPAGTIVPEVGVDAVDMFPLDDLEIFYPTVFWHSYPLTDGVYQNLVTSGLTFMYLYNPRNGVNKDTVDLKFYSSADALVGDVGAVGIGGSGSGDFTPSGVGGESVLQQESFTVVQRGYLCKTNLNPTIMGNYMK